VGLSLVGHHEILMPLIAAAVIGESIVIVRVAAEAEREAPQCLYNRWFLPE
jgi:hypothetical protein